MFLENILRIMVFVGVVFVFILTLKSWFACRKLIDLDPSRQKYINPLKSIGFGVWFTLSFILMIVTHKVNENKHWIDIMCLIILGLNTWGFYCFEKAVCDQIKIFNMKKQREKDVAAVVLP